MYGGGIAYEQPITTGKRISGLPCSSNFIQLAESLGSVSIGIRAIKWTPTSSRKSRAKKLQARSREFRRPSRSRTLMKHWKSRKCSSYVLILLRRPETGLWEPWHPSRATGAILVWLRETAAEAIATGVAVREEGPDKAEGVDEGHHLQWSGGGVDGGEEGGIESIT